LSTHSWKFNSVKLVESDWNTCAEVSC